MQGIGKVLDRINSIEQRFGKITPSNVDFSKVLASATQNNALHEQSSFVSEGQKTSGNIENIIQFSANKYGVDPKLALAVAKVESNLSPDVVSTAGAVGVMQLMPETAQGLGVRNSKDPRENIDGGVRYLKELMTTFDGDLTKVVAAYNAGPQAVQKYNGVPPYSETKDYVAKVMAEYK